MGFFKNAWPSPKVVWKLLQILFGKSKTPQDGKSTS